MNLFRFWRRRSAGKKKSASKARLCVEPLEDRMLLSTIWGGTALPALLSVNDGKAVELGMKFRSDVDGSVNGMSFYKGVGNTGTHVGHLWSSGGVLLATATFTGETASGWQQVNFSSPVAITANTTYVVSYFAPLGHYAATGSYFAVSGADTIPLHALANGVDGSNGLYLYGSDNFPTKSYNSTNYWVDVAFSAVPPVVISQTPAASATGVARATTVTAVFSHSVQRSSISFVLRDAAGNLAPAALSYDDTTHTATLIPSSPLAGSASYTATVSGAQDLLGTQMAAPVSWSFTTVAADNVSIWGTWRSTPPLVNAVYPVNLGVKFRSDVDGVITGIRFYKGPGNALNHVVHLWTGDGTLLATALSTSETSSGWQQVSFSSPVAISANTTYVASYWASYGGYAATPGYFAASGADNGPLHALADGVDGPNGLFADGNDAFPNQSYNSTNYWVDVVFNSAPPANTTLPTVTNQTPNPDATQVSTGTAVTATFSEAVQASTISFVLKDAGGNVVPSTVNYTAATLTATLTPNAPLNSMTTYTATVSATDVVGTPMAAPVSWSFTAGGVWQQTTMADFSAGTQSGTTVTNTTGGEVQLASGFSDDFTSTTLNSAWTSKSWVNGGSATVANSMLSLAGSAVFSTQTFSDMPVEGSVNFGAAPYQHFGLATDLKAVGGNSWAIFSTMGTSNTLFARVNANGATQDVSLGALPTGFHVYRVQPMPGAFQFFVDGVLKTTINATLPAGTGLKMALSAYNATGPNLQVDWVRQVGGIFTSSIYDATCTAMWGAISWTASVPTGTSMIVETRSGSTATPDGTWSNWTVATSGSAVPSPSSRYLEYRVIFITTDPTQPPSLSDVLPTPVLNDITINWS
jgi:hypothetical protein